MRIVHEVIPEEKKIERCFVETPLTLQGQTQPGPEKGVISKWGLFTPQRDSNKHCKNQGGYSGWLRNRTGTGNRNRRNRFSRN